MVPAPADQTAPTAPTGLGSSSVTATSVQLSWSASTDSGGSGLAGYKVFRALAPNGAVPVGTVGPAVLSFTDQPLRPSTTGYNYTVVAFDNAQNHSAASNSVVVTTPASPVFSATGGAISYSGGYTIHTFTASETFTVVSGTASVEVTALGGGGGGGGGYGSSGWGVGGGGGGGAGQYVVSWVPVSSGNAFSVTVGSAGPGAVRPQTVALAAAVRLALW